MDRIPGGANSVRHCCVHVVIAKPQPHMVVYSAVGLRACCVAVGLLLVAAYAAEPVSPLIGITREQLLSRRGEPRSQMETGNRVVYLYPRERVVLRDNVVIEVELLAAEPTESSAPPSATTSPPAEGAPNGERTLPAQTQPASPDSKVEIKFVRPPSKDGRPAPTEPSRPPITPPPVEPVPAEPAVPAPVVQSTPKSEAGERERVPQPASSQPVVAPVPVDPVPQKKAVEDAAVKTKQEAAPAPAPAAPTAASPPPSSQSQEPNLFGVRTYALAFVVIAGGAIALYWRYRQRQLELAASSVENTPIVTSSSPVFSGNAFSADVLARIEWKRFEELVAAYYNKTGVVAVRTKSGPASPVHVKICWKGEQRPFAYVQCIAQPPSVIESKALQAFVSALAADNIRRGYVVTAGRFSVAARDFAAENHLTLLSGDTLIDKLNALPLSARNEIMQAVSAGDYTVPSCPKCESGMVKSAGNLAVWQCPKHPDQTMPVQA
jgi:hypothetical protein